MRITGDNVKHTVHCLIHDKHSAVAFSVVNNDYTEEILKNGFNSQTQQLILSCCILVPDYIYVYCHIYKLFLKNMIAISPLTQNVDLANGKVSSNVLPQHFVHTGN